MLNDLGRADPAALSPVAEAVVAERLTYLSRSKLARIEACAADVAEEGVPGAFVETGVALGGCAIVLATHALAGGRAFHGYDVFELMPAPGEHDPPKAHDRYAVMASGAAEGIGGDTFVFYVEDLYGEVVEAFGRHGILLGDRIALHRGLIEETLRLDEPIALLHVDTDWYDPVRISLERTWPLLSVGGYIVGDDYTTYDGARAAMDEFAGAHGPEVETLWEKGHLILRRLPPPAR